MYIKYFKIYIRVPLQNFTFFIIILSINSDTYFIGSYNTFVSVPLRIVYMILKIICLTVILFVSVYLVTLSSLIVFIQLKYLKLNTLIFHDFQLSLLLSELFTSTIVTDRSSFCYFNLSILW